MGGVEEGGLGAACAGRVGRGMGEGWGFGVGVDKGDEGDFLGGGRGSRRGLKGCRDGASRSRKD